MSSPDWKSLRLPTFSMILPTFLDTSMAWKFVGSQLPTFWTLPWYGNLLEIREKYHGNLLEVEISMIWRGHNFSSVSVFLRVSFFSCILDNKN